MSSKAAAAVYPNLAKAEDQRRQAEVRAKSGGSSVTLPDWARTNDPMWSAPQGMPNSLDRVPGLRRIKR